MSLDEYNALDDTIHSQHPLLDVMEGVERPSPDVDDQIKEWYNTLHGAPSISILFPPTNAVDVELDAVEPIPPEPPTVPVVLLDLANLLWTVLYLQPIGRHPTMSLVDSLLVSAMARRLRVQPDWEPESVLVNIPVITKVLFGNKIFRGVLSKGLYDNTSNGWFAFLEDLVNSHGVPIWRPLTSAKLWMAAYACAWIIDAVRDFCAGIIMADLAAWEAAKAAIKFSEAGMWSASGMLQESQY
ncbi:hypothetical protein PAXINDRAFT_9464 [Paxillus involutus ATCC 200175]|nr:hypothetical protein PAXINDRAFT_9464 [Paxillus involutus ATCC 200175]